MYDCFGKAEIDPQACLIQLLAPAISACPQVAEQGGMAGELPSDSHYKFPCAEDITPFPDHVRAWRSNSQLLSLSWALSRSNAELLESSEVWQAWPQGSPEAQHIGNRCLRRQLESHSEYIFDSVIQNIFD